MVEQRCALTGLELTQTKDKIQMVYTTHVQNMLFGSLEVEYCTSYYSNYVSTCILY